MSRISVKLGIMCAVAFLPFDRFACAAAAPMYAVVYPGMTLPDGIVVRSASSLALDDSATIAGVLAISVPDDSDLLAALFVRWPDESVLVVRSGIEAPGLNGVVFSDWSERRLIALDGGACLFSSGLEDNSSASPLRSRSVWFADRDSIRLLARAGDPAPLLEQGISLGVPGSALLRGGRVAFSSQILGEGGVRTCVWTGRPGELQPIVRTGRPIPGHPGLEWGANLTPRALLSDGSMLVRADLAGPNAHGAGDWSLARVRPNGATLILSKGHVVPGVPGGTWSTLDGISTSSSDDLLVLGSISGANLPNGAGAAVLLRSSEPRLLIASGMALPAPFQHLTFRYWNNAPLAIGGPSALFEGFVSGPGTNASNDLVVLQWNGVELSVVAREGTPIPGIANESFGTGWFPGLCADAHGNFAFVADLQPDPTPTSFEGHVIIQGTRNGHLSLLARDGQPLQVPGVTAYSIRDIRADPSFPDSGTLRAMAGGRFIASLSDGGFERVGAVVDYLPCPADVYREDDATGIYPPVTSVDLSSFLVAFEAGSLAADLDDGSGNGVPDGGVDINDLLYFLAHFEAGC